MTFEERIDAVERELRLLARKMKREGDPYTAEALRSLARRVRSMPIKHRVEMRLEEELQRRPEDGA